MSNSEKWFYSVVYLLIIAYGFWGAMQGDLHVPSKYNYSGRADLYGNSAWLGLLSLIFLLIAHTAHLSSVFYPTQTKNRLLNTIQICMFVAAIGVAIFAVIINPV